MSKLNVKFWDTESRPKKDHLYAPCNISLKLRSSDLK